MPDRAEPIIAELHAANAPCGAGARFRIRVEPTPASAVKRPFGDQGSASNSANVRSTLGKFHGKVCAHL